MPAKEQDIAGMGCILQFFQDMYTAMDAVNNYIIGIDETQNKYPMPKEETERKPVKIPDEWQDYLKNLRVHAKFQIMRLHIQVEGISQIITGFDTKTLNKLHEEILQQPIPDKNLCYNYVSKIYSYFIKSILKDLLRDVNIYSDLVKE